MKHHNNNIEQMILFLMEPSGIDTIAIYAREKIIRIAGGICMMQRVRIGSGQSQCNEQMNDTHKHTHIGTQER